MSPHTCTRTHLQESSAVKEADYFEEEEEYHLSVFLPCPRLGRLRKKKNLSNLFNLSTTQPYSELAEDSPIMPIVRCPYVHSFSNIRNSGDLDMQQIHNVKMVKNVDRNGKYNIFLKERRKKTNGDQLLDKHLIIYFLDT